MHFRDRFLWSRTYAPPAVPVIEPINDDYLASFGRSYAEAKNSAARADSKKKTKKKKKKGGKGGDGEKAAGHESNDDSSSSSDSTDKDDSDKANGGEGGGAMAENAVDVAATPARKTTGSGLSARFKKHGVFLLNLPFELCDEERLKAIFSGFGRINAVVVMKAPDTGR